jgi:hypothetical protein
LLVAGAAAQKVLLKWGPASLSGVADGMTSREGSQSDFQVPESRIVPTATRFDESMPQVGPVDGDPPSASGSQHPAARLVPAAGFFRLTLAAGKLGRRHDWLEP